MKSKKAFIGIDLGKHGAFAIQVQGKQPVLHSMPLNTAGEIDVEEVYRILSLSTITVSELSDIMIVTENLHSVYGASASSNFQFGINIAIVTTIIEILKIPYVKVQAKEWQKLCFKGIKEIHKPGKVKGRGTLETKKMALVAVKRLYPNVDLRRTQRSTKADEGMVDALLMSHYCKIIYK